jgi:hypothetical protein
MKKVIKPAIVIAIAVASLATFSAFKSEKKAAPSPAVPYTISKLSDNVSIGGGLYQWTWQVNNPNPGNGSNGTLQDISHWSIPFNAATEAALVSAEYSYDGVNWHSTSPVMDRDPSIRFCTGVDVLKFDIGTSGTAPTYYRVCLNQQFTVNAFAVSYIKTGGGQQGCNSYLFAGTGSVITL